MPSSAPATSLSRGHRSQLAEKETLFRTRVQLRQPADLARVIGMAVHVLTTGEDWALLVVDEDQLANLARRGFQPRQTDTLRQLGFTRASLNHSELLAALAVAPMDDNDEDGLSDTEEGWWCTDANDIDSDNDLVPDGQEIVQLLSWNYVNGKPFLGWPLDQQGCFDDDSDSVPDEAEVNVIGLNPNRESTDGDKFDDGQEFFGLTKYPDYGALPRPEDTFITPNMPGWVDPPGDNPFVAAYPEIQIDIDPSSTERRK